MAKNKLRISLVDMTILTSIFGDNTEAMLTYLRNFVRITAELLHQAKSAMSTSEKQSALDYFHQLKGPVGSIGFKKMYALCERCETYIAQEDWVAALKVEGEIVDILHKLEIELDKLEK